MGLPRSLTVALASAALAVVAVPSCSTQTISAADCDYVVTRCRTVCGYCYGGYYYGYYGCCYDSCWHECIGDGKPDQPPAQPPAPEDASAPPPAADAGAGEAGPSGDFAVLCAPCVANDECKGGGLCITRGGEDAGTSG